MLKIAFDPIYHHPLPPGHRFPMEKYSLLPQQLIHEGTFTQENFFRPEPLTENRILSVHTIEYWDKLKGLSLSRQEERRTGFPLSEELVQREITIVGGTVQNAEYALEYGVSMNIAGGTHHAYRDRGEGFCLLNDIALGAKYLLDEEKAKRILVVDLDVHQGNGTASIFEDEPRVFTFSMHGGNNYPLHKESSDLDIPLPDGITDTEYLDLLSENLNQAYKTHSPDFVFFQSGVDILRGDKLGRLNVSIEGCKERDRMVLDLCARNGTPVAINMGGGYSPHIKDIIEAHANTFRLAQHVFF